jgi:hypothetical protein
LYGEKSVLIPALSAMDVAVDTTAAVSVAVVVVSAVVLSAAAQNPTTRIRLMIIIPVIRIFFGAIRSLNSFFVATASPCELMQPGNNCRHCPCRTPIVHINSDPPGIVQSSPEYKTGRKFAFKKSVPDCGRMNKFFRDCTCWRWKNFGDAEVFRTGDY